MDVDDLLLTLKNDKLSEIDRLTLENDALRACVQKMAGWRSTNPKVEASVLKCREVLKVASRRRKGPRQPSALEVSCGHVVTSAKTTAGIEEPILFIQRFGRHAWDAWIEDYDDEPAHIGFGTGSHPEGAARDLLAKVKSYAARIKRNAAKTKAV
jgi:hypothetical protein